MRSEYAQAPVATVDDDWKQRWLNAVPCDMPSTVPYPQVALSYLLERSAEQFPSRPACTLYNRTISFRELNEQAQRLAGALANMGAGKGRFVGVLLPNIPEYL